MKKKKNKENRNLFVTIFGVLIIVGLISGGTFAYWSWATADSQKTNIYVEVVGGSLTIEGTNVVKTGTDEGTGTGPGLVPTNQCDGKYALIGEATFTAVNETTTVMRVYPMLDVTLTNTYETLDDTDKAKINWAVVDITSNSSNSCTASTSATVFKGTFATVGKTVTNTSTVSGANNYTIASETVGSIPSNQTTTMQIATISSGTSMPAVTSSATRLTFQATPQATTTRTYRVYVWLDSTYTHENIGDDITDPMQNLNIVVKWSAHSLMTQE